MQGTKPLIFIAGDLNGANNASLLNTHQLKRLNYEATRGSNVLDVILTNAPNCYRVTTSLAIKLTDHKVVIADPPTTKEYTSSLPRKETKYVRSGKIADTVAQIRITNWEERLPFKLKNFMFGNGQQAFDQLYAVTQEAVEYNQPLRAAKTRDDKP